MASGSCHSSSTPKVERRVIEKNRRNHMKSLYANLYSLLPSHASKEAVPLPDQIDEAVKYIESLEMKLKKSKEKKETLSSRKRSHSCTSEFKSPQLEIHEMGSTLDVVLITGEDDKFIFHEIIRLIHEEGAEVLNANFSVFGNSIFHAIHAKAGEFEKNVVAPRVSSRLKEFVHGSMSDVESVLPAESWEFDIEPDAWELKVPQVLPMRLY
ncbi:transcription factor bHLH162-like [Rhododendron vialii]|uniref:transcription factor bHLH162-like n=1 Tax=Rhododendron vialii TaxID=182163 RepID=UPI00265D8471|nr:transcription factor bHLH162-like [Rhododendron vialii]